MDELIKLKNTRDYENLSEILGEELGNLIYKVVDNATKWDKQLNIMHKHLDIIENEMCNIMKDPIKEQIEQCLKEISQI